MLNVCSCAERLFLASQVPASPVDIAFETSLLWRSGDFRSRKPLEAFKGGWGTIAVLVRVVHLPSQHERVRLEAEEVAKMNPSRRLDADARVSRARAAQVEKTAPKEGKNGGRYMVWKLSDLTKVTKASGKQPLQETSMFLFGAAYNDFWREDVGAVFGIRDASVREEVGPRVPPPSEAETLRQVSLFRVGALCKNSPQR